MIKNNVADETIDHPTKTSTELPGSFKTDLEGYRMTAAWARKQMNHYGGKNTRFLYKKIPSIVFRSMPM